MSEWVNAEHREPITPRVCVVLVPLHGVWERRLAQYQGGNWFGLGSTERIRDVRYWCDLPLVLPLRPSR